MANKEYFPELGKIKFEGKDSKNPLAYRYYDPEKVVAGKKMKDWFKFAMAWWHTLCAEGADQFGGGTKTFPWNTGATAVEKAKNKMDAGFEIITSRRSSPTPRRSRPRPASSFSGARPTCSATSAI